MICDCQPSTIQTFFFFFCNILFVLIIINTSTIVFIIHTVYVILTAHRVCIVDWLRVFLNHISDIFGPLPTKETRGSNGTPGNFHVGQWIECAAFFFFCQEVYLKISIVE